MPSLTRTEAAERGAVLTVRSYLVDLDLTTGADTFRSNTTIAFDARPGSEVFLDVQPEVLHSVLLNDRQVDVSALSEGRLPLTGLAAENRLEVVADMRYSRECEGLHRYVDPADDQVYLYAFVYIDNAPRVFACFDQPDLKAPYTFTLTVPQNWQVLGNSEATKAGARPLAGRAHPAAGDLPHRAGGRPVRGGLPGPRRHPAGLSLPGLAGRVPQRRPRRDVRGDRAVPGRVRADVRGALPVRQARPRLRAGVQPAVAGPSGLRAAARAVPVPHPGHRQRARDPRRRAGARHLAAVARRAGGQRLVGRPVAGPGLRRLHGAPGAE